MLRFLSNSFQVCSWPSLYVYSCAAADIKVYCGTSSRAFQVSEADFTPTKAYTQWTPLNLWVLKRLPCRDRLGRLILCPTGCHAKLHPSHTPDYRGCFAAGVDTLALLLLTAERRRRPIRRLNDTEEDQEVLRRDASIDLQEAFQATEKRGSEDPFNLHPLAAFLDAPASKKHEPLRSAPQLPFLSHDSHFVRQPNVPGQVTALKHRIKNSLDQLAITKIRWVLKTYTKIP